MRSKITAVIAVLVVVVGLAGGAAWWTEQYSPSPLTSDATPGPLVVPAVKAEQVARYGVGVSAQYREGTAVNFGGSGTVTQVTVSVGDVVEAGDVVLTVDDVPVLAMVAEAPLWRDLSPGATGEDVVRLQRFLQELGSYTRDVDGSYGTSTTRAVKAFYAAHGDSQQTSTFLASSVVWVGRAPFQVAAVTTEVGATLGPGDTIATGPQSVSGVAVTEPAGGIPEGPAYELVVDDASTPYVPGSGVVSEHQAAEKIAGSLGTTGEGAGQVVTAEAAPVLRVPASAVVVDEAGTSCVFASVTGESIPVNVVGGTLASAELDPDPSISEVLANPLQSHEDPECG